MNWNQACEAWLTINHADTNHILDNLQIVDFYTPAYPRGHSVPNYTIIAWKKNGTIHHITTLHHAQAFTKTLQLEEA